MSLERTREDLKRFRAEIEQAEAQLADMRNRERELSYLLEMHFRYETPMPGDGMARAPVVKEPPRIVKAVVAILAATGGPLPTGALVEELAMQGIRIGGKNPVTNLSGALSKWHSLLRADRRRGWSLADRSDAPGSPLVSRNVNSGAQPDEGLPA